MYNHTYLLYKSVKYPLIITAAKLLSQFSENVIFDGLYLLSIMKIAISATVLKTNIVDFWNQS